MRTTEQTLNTPDGSMRLYEAIPDGTPKGAVIVIMEAFGVNDHIEDVTRRAADAGYHAVSPDLFHRSGGGVAPYDDFGKVMELFNGVTDVGVMTDVDATIDHLHGAGFGDGQIGIVGFCFGGRVTFMVSARRGLGAGVTFYGGGIVSPGGLPFAPLFDEAKTMKTPWLGLFGDKDQSIPVADVEQLREELDRTDPVPHEVVRYDADHGFHCDGRPAAFDADAARDAWSRAIGWFDAHVGKGR
jgi:carboxymethylenebutenolidase